MDAPLAPLPISLGTAIDLALKWFLSGVSKVMFHQVLLQCEVLIAFVTHPLLVYLVDLHVPLETILCFADLCAPEYVTSEPFITLLIILGHF